MKAPVITIDGPSGSGKGAIGLRLAKALHWHFLDSGAVYRALALWSLFHHVDASNENALAAAARSLDLHFNEEIILEGEKVTDKIRSEACSQLASRIAVFPKVRAALSDRLRVFRQPPGLVADGRDMGTIVFSKEAILKIFLEASAEERAKRRYLQLKDKGQDVTLQNLLTEIEERDARDKHRVAAPLRPAEGAVVIDTTGMGIEVVLERVLALAKQRL